MDGFTLKCFGVGDGFPTTHRGHSAFLYRLGKDSLMVDCGDGTTARYEESGLSYDLFDSLLLSHQHADHVGGFLMFLQALWLRRRTKPLEVRMTADGVEPLKRMTHAAYLFPELFNFKLKFTPLRARVPFKVGGVRVTAHPTTHLNGFRPRYARKYRQNFEAFSFLLETGRRRIVHSADLGAPEDLRPLLARPVDVLVCEVAHFTPEALFQFLAGHAIRELVLIHFSDRNWRQRGRLLRLARTRLPKTKCVIAQPGMEIAFGGNGQFVAE
ncbi:MAG TPA: MBL fold metallo-hydrolase [Verrucomicrobiae bacterium]|jgi:ribonuclease BN (tRNA processing enzyme)